MDLEHLMVTIGSVKNKYYIWSRSGGFIWDEVKAPPPFENEKKMKTKKKKKIEKGGREKQCELTSVKIHSIVEYLSNACTNE